MKSKPIVIDIGYTLGKIEETNLEDGKRTVQLTLCQPGDDDNSAVGMRIWDEQGIRNLQEALFTFLLDYDEPETEDTITQQKGDRAL